MSLRVKLETTDVLTDVLNTFKLRGRVFCCSELSAPWAMLLPASTLAHFHVIGRGGGWITLQGDDAATPLASGDLVVVPHGKGHVLSDSPDTPPLLLDELLAHRQAGQHWLRYGGGGTETHLICGSFQFETAAENPVLSLLPPMVHIHSDRDGAQA